MDATVDPDTGEILSMESENPRFRKKTNAEMRRRLSLVESCVRLGFSIEQMVDFLPTWGEKISRSQCYDYLDELRLPRGYKKSEGQQSHHDFFTYRTFIRIAEDAQKFGYQTRQLCKGKVAWEGARFRPDFKFWIRDYLFFVELQLSDLVETRWSVKFKNYLRLYQTIKRPFRVLFIVDQKSDMAYIRSTARRVLKEHCRDDLHLFLFTTLDTFKTTRHNVAKFHCWLTADGGEASLL